MSKSTVTVTFSWFSSNPIFEDALNAVKREMAEKKILSAYYIEVLGLLLPLNGGEPFTGYTECGPHTFARFEAPSLGKAYIAALALEVILRHEFPSKTDLMGLEFRYAGETLPFLLGALEDAIVEAQEDLKGTRKFFPSKRIQRLRVVLNQLHK